MVTLIDDILAKVGSNKQRINALERKITEEKGYVELYGKMKTNAENRILDYEAKIEELKWKERK